DNGKIDVFTTPGGHRRFLRASIDAMLPRPRQARRQSLTALGEAPDRVASEFRRRVRTDLASQDWYSRFDEDSLRWFRERGMRMSELLLGHLDTTRRAGRDQLIEQASLLGRVRRRGEATRALARRGDAGVPLLPRALHGGDRAGRTAARARAGAGLAPLRGGRPRARPGDPRAHPGAPGLMSIDTKALGARAVSAIDDRRDALFTLSRAIHAKPEIAFQEREAVLRLTEVREGR